ncbi:MAG: helix-turn-helix domain-containing protein [Actinomycetota bacterium]
MRQENDEQQSMRRLGAAIKRIRSEQGLNRRELEKETELSYPYLSEIESGKKMPSTQTLRRIAQALGIEAHQLLQEAEEGMRPQDRSAPRPSHFHWAAPVQPEAAPAAPPPSEPVDLLSLPSEEDDEVAELVRIAHTLEPEDLALVALFARRLTR